jgi:hypothetical protein
VRSVRFSANGGFEVSDRINISFATVPTYFRYPPRKRGALCRDLLAEIKNPENPEFEGEIDLDFAKVGVRLSRK